MTTRIFLEHISSANSLNEWHKLGKYFRFLYRRNLLKHKVYFGSEQFESWLLKSTDINRASE